jgi:hypothetical protein
VLRVPSSIVRVRRVAVGATATWDVVVVPPGGPSKGVALLIGHTIHTSLSEAQEQSCNSVITSSLFTVRFRARRQARRLQTGRDTLEPAG